MQGHELRRERHELAEGLGGLAPDLLTGAAGRQLRDRQRVLLASRLPDEPLSAAERAVLGEALAILEAGGERVLAAYLTAIMYRRPFRLPMLLKLGKIPPLMMGEVVERLLHTPEILSEPGDSERYLVFMETLTTELLRLVEDRHPAADTVLNTFANHAGFIPLHFNRGNLRHVYAQRGRLLRLFLERCGAALDWRFPRRNPARRIRVGILMNRLAADTEAYTTIPCFRNLDRIRFEAVLIVLERTGSPMEQACDATCDATLFPPSDLAGAAAAIRRLDLDILLFGTNVGAIAGSMTLLACHRLARIQVMAFSSPVTTGLPTMDHYLSGELSEGEHGGQPHYTERLVLLKGTGFCFEYGLVPQAAGALLERHSLQIAEGAVVFASGANPIEINEETCNLWIDILERVSNAVLLLCPFSPSWTTDYPYRRFAAEMTRAMALRGIARERLRLFAPLKDRTVVKALLAKADVYLDSIPYTGANSIVEPLALGIPVVTGLGSTMRTRRGAAMLLDLGLSDLVAVDGSSYVALAVRLGSDPAFRRATADRIVAAMRAGAGFLSSKDYAHQLETCFEAMVANWEASVNGGHEERTFRADALQHGVTHYLAGRIAEAKHACQAALCDEPGDPSALNLMGKLFSTENRITEAVAFLTRTVRRQPDFLPALTKLGSLSHTVGHHRRAIACFGRLCLFEPSSGRVEARLGTILQDAGDIEAAVRHLRRAMRLGPGGKGDGGEGDATNLGAALVADGRPEAACAALRRAVVLAPAAGYALMLLGNALLALGDPEGITLLDRIRRLDAGNLNARFGTHRGARYHRAARAVPVEGLGDGLAEGLVVRGHPDGVTGYSQMTKRFVRGLQTRAVPLDVISLVDDVGKGMDTPPVRARAALNFLIPTVLEPVPPLATVLFSMFEGSRIPVPWARMSARADLVIVPTESSRQAWAGQGFPEDRLRVCPLGADLEFDKDDGRPLTLLTHDMRDVTEFRHRFLNISDVVPRKNLDGLLRVWLRATTRGDDAILVLKPGQGGDKTLAAVAAAIRRAEQAIGRTMGAAAPINIVHTALSDSGMTALFRLATHYWSLSHGEGWDLPMTKAGAMGLQLIAPRHSAYVDYLDDEVAYMIPSKLAPARLPETGEPWPTFFGLDWWEPDEDAATELIAAIVRGESISARDARPRLLTRFTWGQATDRLIAILRDANLL